MLQTIALLNKLVTEIISAVLWSAENRVPLNTVETETGGGGWGAPGGLGARVGVLAMPLSCTIS